ncbi:MAG: family protein phosphatase [Propionibacteriaceae bacterium]|nr:family protein phosphatase [Propionibacteriaceae bacterium]
MSQPTLRLRFVTHSEIGLVRKNNQDSGFASPHLLAVADGMGGAAAGDLASAVAIDTLSTVDHAPQSGDMLDVLADAIHLANERIAILVEDDPSLDGMGTTVTSALFDGAQLGLAHIGDSRAYLLRDGRLERLTHDHSWVQSLVDDGKISTDEAAIHPHRSLLLKVLNGQPSNEPDLTVVSLRARDRLLFCSDGVCGLVDDPEIAEAMRLGDLDDALLQLIEASHAAGGIDNITVILADVVEADGTDGTFVLGAAAEREIPPIAATVHGAGADLDDDGQARNTAVTAAGAAATGATGTGEPGVADTGEDDEARYTPQPPAKRRLGRTLAGVLVLVLVLGAALAAGYAWTRTQYYVADAGTKVAIYQGLPDGVPGIPLSRVYEVQDLELSSLPPFYQQMVRSAIEVESLAAARETVAALEATAKRCEGRPPRTDSPSTSGKPTASSAPSRSSGAGTARPTPGAAAPSTSSPASESSRPSTPAAPSAPSTTTPDQSC